MAMQMTSKFRSWNSQPRTPEWAMTMAQSATVRKTSMVVLRPVGIGEGRISFGSIYSPFGFASCPPGTTDAASLPKHMQCRVLLTPFRQQGTIFFGKPHGAWKNAGITAGGRLLSLSARLLRPNEAGEDGGQVETNPPEMQRYDSFDGLRGFAAIGILLMHSLSNLPPQIGQVLVQDPANVFKPKGTEAAG
jgi:hypothetical protein